MKLFSTGKPLKVLFVASEGAPFVKVGGLGEIMHSLPKALRELGYDARVFLPRYASIKTEGLHLRTAVRGISMSTMMSDPYGLTVSNVLEHEQNGKVIAYFLENEEFYEKRANVYGYGDDTARWVLLSYGALEFVRQHSKWRPDVIVASDWQAGFIPNLLHTKYKNDPALKGISVLFSIHNLKFQGLFDPHFVSEMDFDAGHQDVPDIFDHSITKLNGMRRGIMFADVINTVSPTYSKEILTEEYGETLHKLLDERKSCLFGILNGIDTEKLNPETDQNLATNYSLKTISNRKKNKVALQKRFGLPEDENKFVVGIVSRLDPQKGIDLIKESIGALLSNIDFQFIIVGDGANEYRTFFSDLQKEYPDRVAGHFFYDAQLPRLIFSGADVMLVPSRFEPCGLVQMEAMRYGCIPIVRKVGGLADSVKDFKPGVNEGTGFVFEKYDPFSLIIAMVRAHAAYGYRAEWEKLQKRAMSQDFSWQKSAQEYVKLFQKAQGIHKDK